jgi:transposase-like protein
MASRKYGGNVMAMYQWRQTLKYQWQGDSFMASAAQLAGGEMAARIKRQKRNNPAA